MKQKGPPILRHCICWKDGVKQFYYLYFCGIEFRWFVAKLWAHWSSFCWPENSQTTSCMQCCSTHGSYYSAKFIFPDLSLIFQNKMNRSLWLICSREIPMWVQIICERSERKKFWTAVCVWQFKTFSTSLLTFAPWYFYIPQLSLTVGTVSVSQKSDNKNHSNDRVAMIMYIKCLLCWQGIGNSLYKI